VVINAFVIWNTQTGTYKAVFYGMSSNADTNGVTYKNLTDKNW